MYVCVYVCVFVLYSSPTVSEEALDHGGRVVVGKMVLEGTTSVVSVICIQGGMMCARQCTELHN